MPKTVTKVYSLERLELDHKYNLEDLCQRLRLESEFVLQCVDYGIAQAKPERETPGNARAQKLVFTEQEALRLKKAARLQRDFGLDYSGLALVLDLLEDVEALRARVRELNRKLDHWEADR